MFWLRKGGSHPQILWYMGPSVGPSMQLSRLLPLAESIMFPPLCLAVVMVFFGSYSAVPFLQTSRCCPTLVSSAFSSRDDPPPYS